jgi:hypothetical protein
VLGQTRPSPLDVPFPSVLDHSSPSVLDQFPPSPLDQPSAIALGEPPPSAPPSLLEHCLSAREPA